MGQLDEPSVTVLLRGLGNVTRLLGVLPGTPEPVTPATVFTQFALIKDYWGDLVTEPRASADGVVLFVVTSLAINPADPLAGVGVA